MKNLDEADPSPAKKKYTRQKLSPITAIPWLYRHENGSYYFKSIPWQLPPAPIVTDGHCPSVTKLG